MHWDFLWLSDPSAWLGLGTLIVIEVVLGIDNLVFISILSSRLPDGQRQRAFSLGLTLALLMRLLLLAAIAWIVTLTRPLLTVWGQGFSVRDLILLVGGVFLLFKATLELHERLEGPMAHTGKRSTQARFWQVVVQILVLDAVFSLDSIITSVGMVKEVSIMMIAVVVAMLAMRMAARPLTNFVEKHPSVIVLCLGFLLLIGLSLIMEGCGVHVPKGYLYAAIAFSALVEAFNQWALRSRRLRLTPRNLRESTARAVLGLLGGQHGGDDGLDMAALASATGQNIFAPEERNMVARVIRLGGRTVRYIMTPRRRMCWLSADAPLTEVLRVASSSPYACIPVQRESTDEVPGVVHLGDILRVLEAGKPLRLMEMLRPAPTVSEHTPLPELLDALRSRPAPLVLVLDEYGSVVGGVTPEDIIHAIAGHMGETRFDVRAMRQSDGSWQLPGRISVDDVAGLLTIQLPVRTSAATLAGLILEKLGHIPAVGETWKWQGWEWEIVRMDGLRIESVRVRRG